MGTSVLSHVISVSIASPFFLRSMSSGRLQRSYLKRWGRMHHYCLPSGYIDTSRRYCSVSVSQSDASETASTSVKKRVVSGVQPTGSIHLGNYLGAIKNWISLQNTYETFFFIVDLHAITLEHDVKQLATSTKSTAAIYMACGVDTTKASVFVQSHVRAHAELMWLLSSVTPIGWLNRMIQFKEKSRKAGDEQVGVALLTYPVLMASDILLYQSDLVPVGEDQKQHLELTRELAERVNYIYGRKWKKMGGCPSLILLISPESIFLTQKILEFDNPDRPECHNLLSIYQLITGRTKEEVSRECQDMNWGTFKTLLTDSLVDHLHPIQVRYEEIMSDSAYLDSVLAEGATKAAVVADATLNNVYQAMGFSRR
ncbi:tryptophan--tRNA ligase, chloroplastic/mitochondrial isoform X4 [Telopea speciosissima]|uniref:tryptophan--tRNA ligase, chloroplastic/mitochondrial isoform X4 n=1 Tax=Telopea speciosissima TaxID=54955 RepID=UPI001CC71B99|nr:tryptophan--tRNA ligase, chloroplastic/mitochondrial isoform X4 [Telopea speciosissima]